MLVASFVLYTSVKFNQQKLNNSLIESIKRNDTSRAIALLNQGADANARAAVHPLGLIWCDIFERFSLWGRAEDKPPSALVIALNIKVGTRKHDDAYADPDMIVQALLNSGADVHIRTDDGETLILLAAEHHQYKVMKEILRHTNYGVNQYDEDHWTPLMYASRDQNNSMVNLLLTRGASINAKDKQGDTALIIASEQSKNSTVVTTLTHEGADVNARNIYGETALIKAAWEGDTNSISLLLNAGADINAEATETGGETALTQAVHMGHASAVKLLITRGASINQSGLLSYAKASHQDDIFDALQRAGAR